MNTATIAIQILLMAPDLIKAGIDIYELLREAQKRIKAAQAAGAELTAADWDALETKITELRAQRDAALVAQQAGNTGG